MKAPAVLCCLLPILTAQERPPLVKLDGGIRITEADYARHLVDVIGSARLGELVLDRILEREAAALERGALGSTTRAALADLDTYVATQHRARLARDFAGDRARWLDHVSRLGRTPDEDLRALRITALRELRTAAIVQATRPADAARLRRVFEHNYGVDGLRVQVRHAFVSLRKIRHEIADLNRLPNGPVRESAVQKRARAEIDELWQAHNAGTPFAELVARTLEDPNDRAAARDPARSSTAGLIANYNFQAFGVEFADAVRAMQPGEVRGPVRTSHGYHIIKLESATRTRLEDVRPRVLELLRDEPPSLGEQREMRERLWEKYRVAEALRR